jgi:hypothetical protein
MRRDTLCFSMYSDMSMRTCRGEHHNNKDCQLGF